MAGKVRMTEDEKKAKAWFKSLQHPPSRLPKLPRQKKSLKGQRSLFDKKNSYE
jgi:hypothetical protein